MNIVECQRKHREMWNWIADKTEEYKRPVSKDEYFIEKGIFPWPKSGCFACHFDYYEGESEFACSWCPIDWDEVLVRYRDSCVCVNASDSPYREWLVLKNKNCRDEEVIKRLVVLARKIANFPFKETMT